MPWLNDDGRANYDSLAFRNGVALWPHPNTTRINPFFRLGIGDGLPYPRASRYIFLIQPYFPVDETFYSGWIDLVAIAENSFIGDSGTDPDGRKMTLEMWEVWDPADPDDPLNRWVLKMTYERAGFTPFSWEYSWYVNAFGFDPAPLSLAIGGGSIFPWVASIDWVSAAVNDWSANPPRNYYWIATQTECGVPGEVIPDLQPFARFNGIDSYIALSSQTNSLSEPWEIEADLYLRDADQNFLLSNTGSGASYVRLHQNKFWWGNAPVVLNPVYPLDEWFHLRATRDWDFAGNYVRVWVNAVLVGFVQTANLSKAFNRLGAFFNNPNTIWGNFDMKNLLLREGGPSSPVTRLDMPLLVNACDIGPASIKGTTFNMDLPSCP